LRQGCDCLPIVARPNDHDYRGPFCRSFLHSPEKAGGQRFDTTRSR
jgi:hypothetical protein